MPKVRTPRPRYFIRGANAAFVAVVDRLTDKRAAGPYSALVASRVAEAWNKEEAHRRTRT